MSKLIFILLKKTSLKKIISQCDNRLVKQGAARGTEMPSGYPSKAALSGINFNSRITLNQLHEILKNQVCFRT